MTAVLAIAGAASVADATPLTEVTTHLTSTAENGRNGQTWESTDNNTVVGIVHTPMNSWGVDANNRPRNTANAACGGGVVEDGACNAGGVAGICTSNRWRRRSPADPAATLYCARHSDKWLNQIWDMLSAGRHQIDITTLTPYGEDLRDAVRNGIQYAANAKLAAGDANGSMNVRLLWGEIHIPTQIFDYIQNTVDPMLARISQLSRGRIPLVRLHPIVMGIAAGAPDLMNQTTNVNQELAYVATGLPAAAGAKINLIGGIYHPSIQIWNHSKIITVDKTNAMVGGHNLWGRDYLDPATPVHDLSMIVNGPAAFSALKYINRLWDVTCSYPSENTSAGNQTVLKWDFVAGASALQYLPPTWIPPRWGRCPEGIAGLVPANVPVYLGGGNVRIVGVGKVGLWDLDSWLGGPSGSGQNPSDGALAAMIRGAGTNVFISQQDVRPAVRDYANQVRARMAPVTNALQDWPTLLGWVNGLTDSLLVGGTWTRPILEAINDRAVHGVPVNIIISDPDNVDGAYQSAGAHNMLDALNEVWPATAADALKCNVSVTYLRDDVDHSARNHAKMIIADWGTANAGYYIGSQNLYGNDLAEYGYMVFNQVATNTLKTSYWDPAWLYSAGANQGRVYKLCGAQDSQRMAAVYGQANFGANGENRGAAVGALTLASPNGVVWEPNGRYAWIMDSNNGRGLKYDMATSPIRPIGVFGQPDTTSRAIQGAVVGLNLGQSPTVNRVTWGGTLNLWSDTNRNRVLAVRWAPLGGIVLGQADFNSGGAGGGPAFASASSLRAPTGVWTDGAKVAVADTGNNRVLLWNNVLAAANGAPADIVIGQANKNTNTAPLAISATSLLAPEGVLFSDGKLFISDTGHNRVLIYNAWPAADNAAADVVLGQNAMNAGAAATSVTGMRGPVDVEMERDNLFVADAGNNRVLVYHPVPTANNTAASHVLGEPDFNTQGPGAVSDQTLNDPQDLSITAGKLLVADKGNNRVVEYRVYLQP